MLGAVAGGGDPAGVAAALDPRIRCVVPFNFGGPMPETDYPLPPDAEANFDYVTCTPPHYWEAFWCWPTRGPLRLSARDDIDGSRVGLWGESFAPVNPADLVDPPLTAKRAGQRRRISAPAGPKRARRTATRPPS